jgi:hypothetical protein
MKAPLSTEACIASVMALVIAHPAASQSAPPQDAGTLSRSEARDGSPDFDCYFGNWKERSSRLLHPLSGSKEWVEMTGATVVKPIWQGRANIAEFKSDGPLELLSLRWYNPTTHQWNIDFATPGVGMLGIPAVGEFKNGRADFYDHESINSRSVLVRFSIWKITENTAQSEQAFSDDGGKTWEINWVNRYTRDGK